MPMPASFKRRVKIVCTLGPSSHTTEKIASLLKEGMDIARLNFSHGDHKYHAETITNIRAASKQLGKPVPIMQDLQGPKIRLGELPDGGVEIATGDVVHLHPESDKVEKKGKKTLPVLDEIALPISKSLSVGAKILFDDGKLMGRVTKVSPPHFVVEFENGGVLTSHKGINLPGTPLPLSCLTDKDFEDLKFGLDQGVDAIALSFVRSAEDIEALRKQIKKKSNLDPLIVSKIEREEAVYGLESIIDVSDVIMVARGDMAVELGAERVPVIQKQMIAACNEIGVPVITATQMLESMIVSATPTRAEASDVANAVFDGTDAVMLSAETASGKYATRAVKVMSQIIIGAERSTDVYGKNKGAAPLVGSIVDSVEFSASRIAQHVGAVAIACVTHSGKAARTLSKYRPQTPIVAIMDSEENLRKLTFVWGIHGEIIPEIANTDDVFLMVEDVLKQQGWAKNGDLVVITAGVPTLRRGTTNMVKVHKVGAPIERIKSQKSRKSGSQ